MAFIVPLIVGCLLALIGAWIASSFRSVLPSRKAATVKYNVALDQ